MTRWLRRLFGSRTGESYAEAYARIAAEIERDYPIEKLRADSQRKANEAWARREAVRVRNDHGGEYERGMEGLQ
jgi:ribosomal protein S24E